MRHDSQGRADPRISAPKMGEYLDAPARRRERIIRDQKFPEAFITTRYGGASDVIRRGLLLGEDVPQALRAGANRLSQKPCESRHAEEIRDNSVLAIEHFLRMFPSSGLDGLDASLVGRSGLTQFIETVRISIYPVAILRQRVRGQDRYGGLLLVFGKNLALTAESGRAIATLLYNALAESDLVAAAAVKPNLCLVADVFRERFFEAPRSQIRIVNDIKSACREIAVRWPSIRRVGVS